MASAVIKATRGADDRGPYVYRGTLQHDEDVSYGTFPRVRARGAVEMRHGVGECAWSKGDVYFGEWRANVMQGIGVSLFRGARYEGEYSNGQRHGFGTGHDAGTTYVGQWSADVQQGLGAAQYADGRAYSGEWNEGLRHGRGVLTTSAGERMEGLFRDNVFVESASIAPSFWSTVSASTAQAHVAETRARAVMAAIKATSKPAVKASVVGAVAVIDVGANSCHAAVWNQESKQVVLLFFTHSSACVHARVILLSPNLMTSH